MGKIRVNTDALEQQKQQMEQISKMLHSVSSDISSVNRNLSWKIASRSQIKGMLKNYASYTSTLEQKNRNLSKVLQTASQQYQRTEKKLGNMEVAEAKAEAEVSKAENEKTSDTDDIDSDIIRIIKNILSVKDKLGDDDEAGIAKDAIEYLEKLLAFLNGDKKGFTGAGDWCSLADASFSVWKGLYDWYCKIYKDAPEGIFSKIAQKEVKVAGLGFAFMGLIGSVSTASDGLDDKKWQSITADYLDCGKDLFSVIKAGYEVKKFGDLKSLVNLKKGPWSAAGIYKAIADGIVDSVSQGFRSQEKYYEDGVWSLEDTAATGIDLSVAGLYGMVHTLTFGCDELAYEAVKQALGIEQSGSYKENVTEGLKNFADRMGERIGNLINNIRKNK